MIGGGLLLSSKIFSQETKSAFPCVISTWSFGKKANEAAWKFQQSALDAVEKGINVVELDPKVNSVGYGGLPNEDGEVTLDAMIMDGATHRAGAVGCLKKIKTPISVARKVMEKTKHTMLVGADALEFAKKMGFVEEDLLTEESRKLWENWKANPERERFWSHDTIGMVFIDTKGNVAAGCSTSGLAYKIAGRVGDSPIVGAGAYCDNTVGGAAATGNGDIMMRFCPTYQAVEFMRGGAHPKEACEMALKRITDKGFETTACLVALDRSGRYGAAKIGKMPFQFAVRTPNVDSVFTIS